MKCGGISLASRSCFRQVSEIRANCKNEYCIDLEDIFCLIYCSLLGFGHKRTSDKLKNDKKKIFS